MRDERALWIAAMSLWMGASGFMLCLMLLR
jgi:hypothetical protein